MTRDPIRRRFGHGAARLPLGMPPGSERLSERARQPVQHERRLTLVLPLVAACVAALVVTALQPVQTLSPPTTGEIQIVLGTWSAKPASPQTASPVAVAVPVARRAAPSPTFPAGQTTDSKPTPRFDPGALATRAPDGSDEAILPAPREAGSAGATARAAARSARAGASRPMPAGLAVAPRSRLTQPSFDSIGSD